MNREEVIARGWEVHETKHSMKRRSPWHDYHRKGTYMLTLVVDSRMPLLGELKGNADVSLGSNSMPRVELSELGDVILRDEIGKINKFYPQVEVWKVCIMPDHIHMIVRVKEQLPNGKHLGSVVRGFKTGCTKAWWRLQDLGKMPRSLREKPQERGQGLREKPQERWPEREEKLRNLREKPQERWQERGSEAVTVSSVYPEEWRPVLFEEGYNDKILLHEGQLDNWKTYLDDNPRRLFIKRQNPHLFTVLSGMEVAGRKCQTVGNRFLLYIPDKMAVIVHRRYTDEENARLREEWLSCGERGGVLVSAAISPKEKEVLREAMNRGYRIILLRENGFPELYKPSGESFEVCSQGLLLQISPWEYHMERKVITRAQCLELNNMAERIAGNC